MAEKYDSYLNYVKIGIASSERMLELSHGEVTKTETINYRTFRAEPNGLFCEKIFGPTHDWHCYCGKYRKIKYKGIVCDRCEVEVTRSKVRRERMGHIVLVAPVVHIWFLKGAPSAVATLLNMNLREVERVVYYECYIVTDPKSTKLSKNQLLSSFEVEKYVEEWGEESFECMIGGDAVKKLLSEVNLEEMMEKLKESSMKTSSVQMKSKLVKALELVENMKNSDNSPEWMVLDTLPVIPPELRPLVPLDGGRFASSDLNDLYRRVINRNNRLRRLIELGAPEVIICNEKRMLQEAVDCLFDNGKRGRPITGSGNRPLKSLSDMLKGKQGRFRQNLLGKRVDYSGRSVIVVGPKLKLHQCGVPKKMALELFEPFIIRKMREKGFLHTLKLSRNDSGRYSSEVFDVLEEVIKDHPVLLNRAPTLHRLGIQAFEVVLVEGNAIHLHPAVCPAFNADFDGDQMAMHVPLSVEAQIECKVLMLASHNLFSPASGDPIATPSQDIVLGIYYATMELPDESRSPILIGNLDEAEYLIKTEIYDLHHPIIYRDKVRNKEYRTTLGRGLFSSILPKEVDLVNKAVGKKELSEIISDIYTVSGHKRCVKFLDDMKDFGFENAVLSGVSICYEHMSVPKEKEEIVASTQEKVDEINFQYQNGFITDQERYNKAIDMWTETSDKVAELLMEVIKNDRREGMKINPIYMMAVSGARGSKQQIKQLAGMRGLMAKPSGDIVEFPILSSFIEGLGVLEYFISTHGARKGLADTALKTADSGYLTRRLVDATQDIVITQEDCETSEGIFVAPIIENDSELVTLGDRILGRYSVQNVVDLLTDELVLGTGEEVTKDKIEKLEKMGIKKIKIRSPLTCEAERGLCAKCYGRDLAHGKTVEQGTAVGIIAAQSIGEPGTQLTMRTFHVGGAASRVLEESDLKVKSSGVVEYHHLRITEGIDGKIWVLNRNGEVIIKNNKGRILEKHVVPSGSELFFKEGQEIKEGDMLAQWDLHTMPIIAEDSGKIVYEDLIPNINLIKEKDALIGVERLVVSASKEGYFPQMSIQDENGKELSVYSLPVGAIVSVKDGQEIRPGEIVAKFVRKMFKTVDIVGGLERVAENFEARKPKDPAVISEIDGVVDFGGHVRGLRKVIVKSDAGTTKEYLISHNKQLVVYKGDYIKAGDPLCAGPIVLQDVLKVTGVGALQDHLLNNIQGIYRMQGVVINDKHIEVVVKQMLRKVKIEEVGDSRFQAGILVNKRDLIKENERLIEEKKHPAKASPVLLGITKAALVTDSFISAASFQETTKVLTRAAISGSVDHLYGQKENVVLGSLIPSGTGYKNLEK